MSGSQRLLFSIKASHSYFDDQSCRVLMFQPDEKTIALFRDLQCQFRNKEGEFQVYGPSHKTKSELLSSLNGQLEPDAETKQNYFKFNLISSDQNFYLYTDLPIDSFGQILYESSGDSFELNNTIGEERNAMSIGAVQISWDHSLGNEDNAPEFELAFKARSIELRYYIIPQNSNSEMTLAIKSETNIQFDGPNPVKMPNGAEGYLFTSGETLVPVCQLATSSFKLVINAGTRDQLEISLPHANIQQTTVVEVDGKKTVGANVYVYV